MTADRLRVGLPVSRTGRFSRRGEQVLAGVEHWTQWTNGRGGIPVADGLPQYEYEGDATGGYNPN